MQFPWYWPEWQHKLWEKSRAHGKKGFMLRQALPWGIFMFFAMGAYMLFSMNSRGIEVQFMNVVIHGIICAVGGWGYGAGSWYFGEKFYSRHLAIQSTRTQ